MPPECKTEGCTRHVSMRADKDDPCNFFCDECLKKLKEDRKLTLCRHCCTRIRILEGELPLCSECAPKFKKYGWKVPTLEELGWSDDNPGKY